MTSQSNPRGGNDDGGFSAKVMMGLLFYPRGGSAQVVRYLAAALKRAGRRVDLVTGSLGQTGEQTNASTFFTGLEVHPADFTDAVIAWENGSDPMEAPMPMHPSFERRENVPDRIFTDLNELAATHQINAWKGVFKNAGGSDTDLFHLHHLTPLQLAVHDLWPTRPIVTHLHGTELKMLDALNPDDPWAKRLVHAAELSNQFIAISPHDRDEAIRILGIDPTRVTIVPNGVDTTIFDRFKINSVDKIALWRKWLVDEPFGWDETGRVGSVSYSDEDLQAFQSGDAPSPVLIFVGRFLGFKRVPLLIRAYARARKTMSTVAPLVIWGGSPGEWEGEHPVTVARKLGVPDVFFAGWRGHDELPLALNASDVMVAPSVNEPFGQVYLEAMACGLPVIATNSGGPPTFVNTNKKNPNGWLVNPDDEEALAETIASAVNNTDDRHKRAEAAFNQIRDAYSWDVIAHEVAQIYDNLLATR